MGTLRDFYFYGIFSFIKLTFGQAWAKSKSNVAVRATGAVIIFHLLFLTLILIKLTHHFGVLHIVPYLTVAGYDLYYCTKYYRGEKYLAVLEKVSALKKHRGWWPFATAYTILPVLILLYVLL